MINISHKQSTLRSAIARGRLIMSPTTVQLIREKKIKKGDVVEVANVAGIEGAKQTSEWVIFAHPIPLDGVEVSTELLDDGLEITVKVQTVWKTGVEVEAITAVTNALLNVLDMLKPHDTELMMSDIRVIEKTGGKNDFKDTFEPPLKAAVLVISDSTFAGDREDKSGKIIQQILEDQKIKIEAYDILPDDTEKITARVSQLIEKRIHLIITTGGTGFGPKDMTPEAVAPLIEKEAPGIVEQIRGYGTQRTPYAMLSREVAGIAKESLLITLPGSSNGARESMQALFPGVLHLFRMMWGGGHAPPENQ